MSELAETTKRLQFAVLQYFSKSAILYDRCVKIDVFLNKDIFQYSELMSFIVNLFWWLVERRCNYDIIMLRIYYTEWL